MKSNATAALSNSMRLISLMALAAALGLISTPAARASVFTVDATFSDSGTLAGSFNPTSPYTGTSLTFTDPSFDCSPCTDNTLTGSDAGDIYFAGCVLGSPGDFCFLAFSADFFVVPPGGTDTITYLDDFEIQNLITCATNCAATSQASTPEPSSATMLLLGCAAILGFIQWRGAMRRQSQ